MRRLRAVTLVELIATMAIIGVMTALAIPSARKFSGRTTLQSAQKGVESLFYRMRQLSLAPPVITTTRDGDSAQYDILGYGLVFFDYSEQPVAFPEGEPCRVRAENDFIALIKIVRYYGSNGATEAMLNGVDPLQPACGEIIEAGQSPNDFYVLPKGVTLRRRSGAPEFPWALSLPTQGAGQRFGDISSFLPDTYWNPNESTELYLAYPSITVRQSPLCRSVNFATDLSEVTISETVVGEECASASD